MKKILGYLMLLSVFSFPFLLIMIEDGIGVGLFYMALVGAVLGGLIGFMTIAMNLIYDD